MFTDVNPVTPQPHTKAQPGLRGHSWNPKDDLLKKYLILKSTPSGWLGIASFDERPDAELYVIEKLFVPHAPINTFKIVNQFETD